MAIPDEWYRLEQEGIWIPVPVVPKERPKVGNRGVYYSKRYTDFREAVVEDLSRRKGIPHALEIPLSLEASFASGGFWLQLRPLVDSSSGSDIRRPKKVRGDIDNLIGGVADAIQDAGIVANDSWFFETHARCWEGVDNDE